jgi:tyrosine-protein kinase Etk/Wzc
LNKLADVYLQSSLDEKNSIVENTINFIDRQLNGIIDSLKIAEDNLLNFRLTNNVIDISQEGGVIFQKLERLQNEKALLNIKFNYYTYIYDYVQSKSDLKDLIAPSSIGIEDPLLNSLIMTLNEYMSEKNVLSYSAKDNTPSLNLINVKIQNAKETLLENLSNIIKTTEITLKDYDKRISLSDSEIKKLPVTEQQLIKIQRKFELSDNIYTYLLEKRAEAGIAQASNIPDNKVLDMARSQNAVQVAPKKSLNYMIALIIGILMPLVVIIILDFFNNKISDRKDIEDGTNVPIIGSIGHNNKETELVVHEKPKSSIAESFRTLRTNVHYILLENKSHVISISSTVSGEGKTFCAINIGSIFAISNKKTLLVGLDLRKPKLHKDLNLENEIGMSSYLIGKNTLAEILIETSIPNLFVIPSGPVPPNPAELIESDKFAMFMEEARAEFDYIVLDTPPIALVTDALLISKHCDANLFVIRQNYSTKTVVKLVNELKENKKIKNFAIVLNDVKVPYYYGIYGRYGYSYSGNYQYGYNYGYGYYDDDPVVEMNWIDKLKGKLRIRKNHRS